MWDLSCDSLRGVISKIYVPLYLVGLSTHEPQLCRATLMINLSINSHHHRRHPQRQIARNGMYHLLRDTLTRPHRS